MIKLISPYGRKTCVFGALFLALTSCYKGEQADLIIHNAFIVSADQTNSTYEAMAVKDGKIIALGAEREILNRYRADEIYDARKMTVYPGFIDAHSHFSGFATNKGELSLFGVQSAAEMMAKVSAFALDNNREWIVGRGWDHTIWTDQQYPNRTVLDSLFPDRPVALQRVDGHAMLANSEAFRRAGISPSTFVPGGGILRNEQGELTGILLDDAADLVSDVIEPLDPRLLVEKLIIAQQECFAAGLTMVSDFGLPLKKLDFLDSLYRYEYLQLPLYALYQPGQGVAERLINGPIIRESFVVRGVKLYGDGALGSRGALLKHAYSDQPESKGINVLNDSIFDVYSRACYDNGFQLCIHAIGDSANALALKKMADVLGEINDLRWRIEHAQVVSPEDRHYFRDFGIIPSMQPIHATSDMAWVKERLGEERENHAYALKSLKEMNGIMPFGTDFPVEDISPIANFYAAVFRKKPNGMPIDGYKMDEALTREDALKGLTIWAAIACFEEHNRGSLEIGKRADFIVVDRNLLTCNEADVLRTKVMATYLAGQSMLEIPKK